MGNQEIVMFLLKSYLGKSHAFYVNNLFISPLFDILHKNGTNACGTVKKRRKGMPNMDEKLQKGEACFCLSEHFSYKIFDGCSRQVLFSQPGEQLNGIENIFFIWSICAYGMHIVSTNWKPVRKYQ